MIFLQHALSICSDLYGEEIVIFLSFLRNLRFPTEYAVTIIQVTSNSYYHHQLKTVIEF